MDVLKTVFSVWTVIAAVLFVTVLMLPWLLRKRGVTMKRTRFGITLIFDSENADGTPVRLLNVNGAFQSVSYVPEDLRFELACEYHREMARVIEEAAAARGTEQPLRVLVMGGGGCSLPKYLAAYVPSCTCEVVEIDPAITQIARDYFFLDECLERTGAGANSRLQVVDGDAWAYVQNAEKPFDVIVNEAFSGKKPLGPMETSEGARVVREHLTPGGIYLADVRCPLEGHGTKPLQEVKDAFGREFARCDVVPEWPGEPKKPGNNVFVARLE